MIVIRDARLPLGDFGKVLGYIPQAEKTYAYIHSGYPQMNEHQLAIAESTTFQRDELMVDVSTGNQIMTIEMAQVFALQRCRTAKEAIRLITSLVEKYGFLPSAGPNSETLCIADAEEAWVLEIFSVGPFWSPDSGELGVIWAAQRVPDDHVCIVPNWSIIKEIDLSRPEDFMASKNYMQVAIDYGWYVPESGKPFIWQEVIAFQRSTFEGTIYDMTADVDWFVPNPKGELVKSPLTTPFPRKEWRELLDITWRRVVSMGGYGEEYF